jgi:twitching motility protein PilT
MYSAIQTGQQYGMMTLDQTLQNLVQQGVISRQQAQLKASNKDSI